MEVSGITDWEEGLRISQEWRNGWLVVLTSVMGMGVIAAPAYSLGAFMVPFTAEFGWTHAQIAGAISVTSLISGAISPLSGHIVDRWGARKLALAGVIITCAAVTGFSRLQGSILAYWVLWALGAFGVGLASPVVWTMAVATRFKQSRGLALSVVLCGTSLAGVLAPPLVMLLILHFGWRVAYLGLALYMFISAFPLTVAFFYDARDLDNRAPATELSRNSSTPTRSLEGLTLGKAAKTATFWLMAVSFFLAAVAILGVLVNLIPLLTSKGLPPMFAASAASALSASALIGRVGGGFFMDRVFAPRIAAFAFTLPILACAGLLLFEIDVLGGFIVAIMFGLALGAEVNMLSYLTSRYFGLRSYGVIYGAMYAIFSIGQALGPPLIGKMAQISGDYRDALVLLAVCYFLSAALLQLCGHYPDWSGPSAELEPPQATAGAIDGAVPEVV